MDTTADVPLQQGFEGFGEAAPLEVPDSPAVLEAIRARFANRTIRDFADAAAAVRNCAHPIRMVGSSVTYDKTTGAAVGSFSSADAPLGVLYLPCGNRRADVCGSCARLYARDTFELIRAGVVGGKGIPATVSTRPLLFATFTAPSFGAVHSAKDGKRCRPRDKITFCPHGRPLGCMQVHHETEAINGAPLCADCYDWNSAVIWQCWSASELFRRTGQNIARELAGRLGISQRQFRDLASVQYVKVAEYQHRGLVHFHLLIRLDGAEGPGTTPALDVDADILAAAVVAAARRTKFTAPPIDDDDALRVLGWGQQLDVREVRADRRLDNPAQELSAEQVAGYIAKYVTKDSSAIRRPGGKPRWHLIRLQHTCDQIATRAAAATEPVEAYLRLAKWAHMLGFPGHFSSKSRRYSVTLGALRRARRRFMVAASEAHRRGEVLDLASIQDQLLAEAEETTLVVGSWAYQGTGWTNPGDQVLALATAARTREYDQWRAQQRKAA